MELRVKFGRFDIEGDRVPHEARVRLETDAQAFKKRTGHVFGVVALSFVLSLLMVFRFYHDYKLQITVLGFWGFGESNCLKCPLRKVFREELS